MFENQNKQMSQKGNVNVFIIWFLVRSYGKDILAFLKNLILDPQIIAHTQNHQEINRKAARNILLTVFGLAVAIAGCALIFGCTDIIFIPTIDDNRAEFQPNCTGNPCADVDDVSRRLSTRTSPVNVALPTDSASFDGSLSTVRKSAISGLAAMDVIGRRNEAMNLPQVLRAIVAKYLVYDWKDLYYVFLNSSDDDYDYNIDIGWDHGLIIKTMHLNGQQLRDSNIGDLSYLPSSLLDLSLHHNILTRLDTRSLPRNLRGLGLRDNQLQIQHFDISALPQGLKYLNIMGNPISFFRFDELPRSLESLELPSIDWNKVNITALPRNLFDLAVPLNIMEDAPQQVWDQLDTLNITNIFIIGDGLLAPFFAAGTVHDRFTLPQGTNVILIPK